MRQKYASEKSGAFFNLIKNQIKYRDDQYPTK